MTIETLGPMLTMGVLTGARVSGVMVFAPMLNSPAIPARVKAVLTLALTFLLTPLGKPPGLAELTLAGGAGAILSEMLVGLLLGLTLQFVFEAAQFAGQILGFQMGYSLASVFDPQSQAETPVLATLNQLVVLMIFLHLNVHHWLLRGLARSVSYVPLGSATWKGPALHELLRSSAGLWLAGVQIAAPALAATLLADVALGFLGKASPQLPVLFIGLPVKSMLGMVVLTGAVAYWPRFFESHFLTAIGQGERLLQLVR